MTLELGRPASFSEVEDCPYTPHANDYAFYFGSFSEAAHQAYNDVLLAKRHGSKELLLQQKEVTKMKQSNVAANNHEKTPSSKPRYEYESLLKIMVEFYEETGRVPKQLEVRAADGRFPAWRTLTRYLGPREIWEEQIKKYLASRISRASEATEEEEAQPSGEESAADSLFTEKEDSADTIAVILSPEENEGELAQKAKMPAISDLDSHLTISVDQDRLELRIEKISKPLTLDIRF